MHHLCRIASGPCWSDGDRLAIDSCCRDTGEGVLCSVVAGAVGMSGGRTLRLFEIALGVEADGVLFLVRRAGVVNVPWVEVIDGFPETELVGVAGGRDAVVESEAAAFTAPSYLRLSSMISVEIKNVITVLFIMKVNLYVKLTDVFTI